MHSPNVDPSRRSSIRPRYRVTMSGDRWIELRRLKGGGAKLELSAPARDGSRRIHGVLDFGAERVIEALLGISVICQDVDEHGLPPIAGEEQSDAA